MKNIEKTAIGLIALYIISSFVSTFGNQLAMNYATRGDSLNLLVYRTIPLIAVRLIFNTALAIWIFKTAKKEESKTPWVWALFGFVFSVPGAILFYVMLIYQEMKSKTSHSMEPIANPSGSR